MKFSLSIAADIATNEAFPLAIGACSTCERTGLPILPLRAAYAPEPLHTQALPLSRGSDVKAVRLRTGQVRTLRRGYLYVLLDKKEWQAYEVTPEGALRQFRPYQVPREEPRSLCELCIRQDHDIPAAFLNIDINKYSTAWLAFANDPWPESVLNRYARGGMVDGMNLEERFHKLDLQTVCNDPASVGIAMTEHNLQLEQVLEYAQSRPGDFHSVHGFHGRNDRLRALKEHVGRMSKEHGLPNGVLAVVLPDPIGMVQELNAQRLARYQAMLTWCAEPQRSFEYFTSRALLGIREVQLDRAKEHGIQEAKELVERHLEHHADFQFNKSIIPLLDLEKEKQRKISEAQADAIERLGDRYDEKARAKFEASYLQTLAGWQRVYDDVAEVYVRHCDDADFQLAVRQDYSVTSVDSVQAFILMNRSCLAGGPIKRFSDDKADPVQALWLRLLEDRESLFHQSVHAKDKALLDQWGDDLMGDERTRVFHTIKTFIGTDEGQRLMVEPVQTAIGELLAAGATASYALGEHLSANARLLLGHLHREALLRFSGVKFTQLTISLRVGEYLTLLNEVLYEGSERFIAQLDKKFRKPAEQKVRAMLLHNKIIPALAGNHATLIDIKIWTMESAEDLHARLDKLRAGIGNGVGDALRQVRIGATALTGSLDDLTRHFTLNAEVSRLLARDTMRSLRNTANAIGPTKSATGLALGSLYFQWDALLRSYENLLKTVGEGRSEAAAAVMSASVGVMGATVESVGGVIGMVRPDLKTTVVHAGGAVKEVGLGIRVMQYGGALVAVASVVEGLQYAMAAGRAGKAGDQDASNAYGGGSALAVVSGVVGIWGALVPASMALFPLSVAVLLGLAAYGFAAWAKQLESDAMELWARHSLWGLPKEHRNWTKPDDMDTATAALNAALLGLIVDASMNIKAEQTGEIFVGDAVPVGMFLDYRIVLPGYKANVSNYKWALQVFRPGECSGKIIARGSEGGANEPLPAPASWKKPGYRPETSSPVIEHNAEAETLEIKGAISFFGNLDVHALELEVSYWPDKNDEAGVARLIVKEDKIGEWKGWSFG